MVVVGPPARWVGSFPVVVVVVEVGRVERRTDIGEADEVIVVAGAPLLPLLLSAREGPWAPVLASRTCPRQAVVQVALTEAELLARLFLADFAPFLLLPLLTPPLPLLAAVVTAEMCVALWSREAREGVVVEVERADAERSWTAASTSAMQRVAASSTVW